MPLLLDSLPSLVQDLQKHPESLRIKKLVFCLAQRTWENDLDVLSSFSLTSLLQEILVTQPKFSGVVFNTYQIILSINRRKIYVGLAQYLLEKLRPIYNDATEQKNDNYYLVNGVDVRKLNFNDLLEPENQQETETEIETYNGSFMNIMELAVNEEIFQQIKNMPLGVAKHIKPSEVATYALNRLPSLYASSEKGKQCQDKKIVKDVVQAAVKQGIAAVMRDPLRKSQPLNVSAHNIQTEAYNVLMELKKTVEKQYSDTEKVPFTELVQTVIKTLEEYEAVFAELSTFLRWYGFSEEKVTRENLVSVVRKTLRKQTASNLNKNTGTTNTYHVDYDRIPDTPETENFDISEDHSDDMSTAFSEVRDWYTH